MSVNQSTRKSAPILIGVLASALALAAQAPPLPAPASVRHSPTGLSWSVFVRNNGAVLSVAGGNAQISKKFKGGNSLSFDPVDSQGNALPDGVYNWELTFSPPGVTASDDGISGRDVAAGRTGASTNDQAVGPDTARQLAASMKMSGVFTIVFGSIVDPNVPEPDAGPLSGQ